MTKKSVVKFTDNFERNLEEIECFLADAEQSNTFDRLLDELLEVAIPNLEKYPEIGLAFLQRPARSVEVINALATVTAKLSILSAEPNMIREYMLKHCILLYAIIGDSIVLLTIRHHRQLTFNLEAYWPQS